MKLVAMLAATLLISSAFADDHDQVTEDTTSQEKIEETVTGATAQDAKAKPPAHARAKKKPATKKTH